MTTTTMTMMMMMMMHLPECCRNAPFSSMRSHLLALCSITCSMAHPFSSTMSTVFRNGCTDITSASVMSPGRGPQRKDVILMNIRYAPTSWLKCCFTSTETIGLLGTGTQDGYLDFHTAPDLCNAPNRFRLAI